MRLSEPSSMKPRVSLIWLAVTPTYRLAFGTLSRRSLQRHGFSEG
jgi:hypothetical protein